MADFFEINNFLTESDYTIIKNNSTPRESFIDPNGVFKGSETCVQQWFKEDTELGQVIVKKLSEIEYLKDNKIDGMQITDMIKPFDIHNDYLVQMNQVPLSDPTINKPAYTIIIPLVDGAYQTLVFNQRAMFNNFSEFKKQNKELDKYVSDAEWKRYCGHCHLEDQKYLTIKKIWHWQKGNLFAFDRCNLHASANFTTPKRAIVIWSSK